MNTAFFFLVIAFSRAFSTNIPSNPLSDDFIDYINSQQSTWRAGKNFDESTPTLHIRSLLGSRTSPKAKSLKTRVHSEDVEIPESFDARENWPECEIIRVIKDQSACGSCWAVSATSVMSDRICIHSNGKKQTYVSDEDLLSCCLVCGMGCSGGDPSLAWYYWNVHGISSGGPYNSTTIIIFRTRLRRTINNISVIASLIPAVVPLTAYAGITSVRNSALTPVGYNPKPSVVLARGVVVF